jgi:hypothetical protein
VSPVGVVRTILNSPYYWLIDGSGRRICSAGSIDRDKARDQARRWNANHKLWKNQRCVAIVKVTPK